LTVQRGERQLLVLDQSEPDFQTVTGRPKDGDRTLSRHRMLQARGQFAALVGVAFMVGLAGIAAAQPPAPAQNQPAVAFVMSIYNHFRSGTPLNWNVYAEPVTSQVFDPSLAQAMREESRLATRLHIEMPDADTAFGDIEVFCMCQDDESIRATVRVITVTDAKTTALVTLHSRSVESSVPNPPEVLRFTLVSTPAGWRVFDVVTSKGDSFRQSVFSVVQSLRAQLRRR
jgi:hypothetical protein